MSRTLKTKKLSFLELVQSKKFNIYLKRTRINDNRNELRDILKSQIWRQSKKYWLNSKN
jgi:hypothetical protein